MNRSRTLAVRVGRAPFDSRLGSNKSMVPARYSASNATAPTRRSKFWLQAYGTFVLAIRTRASLVGAAIAVQICGCALDCNSAIDESPQMPFPKRCETRACVISRLKICVARRLARPTICSLFSTTTRSLSNTCHNINVTGCTCRGYNHWLVREKLVWVPPTLLQFRGIGTELRHVEH
jgi:hypothetical protein